MIECVIREHESHAEEQGDFCEFCGFCVQKYLTQTTQTGADFVDGQKGSRKGAKFRKDCLQFIVDISTKEHKASRPLRLCVRHFTTCNILENTNLTNFTNQSTRKSMLCRLLFLLIAYKLHESMRGDNANVETSYYGTAVPKNY